MLIGHCLATCQDLLPPLALPAASLVMEPCLVLMLSTLIPVEARLCYVTLHHAAYADKGVANLGQMASKILVGRRIVPFVLRCGASCIVIGLPCDASIICLDESERVSPWTAPACELSAHVLCVSTG
jgi:hypothetical protein